MSPRVPRVVPVVVAFILVLSACGGADSGTAVAAAGSADEPAAIATTAPVQAAPDESADAAESPTEPAAQPTDSPAPAATEAPVVETEPEAESEPEPEPEEAAAPAPAAATVALPDVQVYDLATGATAELASFAKPGATLVWFWAPH